MYILLTILKTIPNYCTTTHRTKRFKRTGYRQMYYRYILERCRKSCHPKLQIVIQNCGRPAGLTCHIFTFHDDNHVAFYRTCTDPVWRIRISWLSESPGAIVLDLAGIGPCIMLASQSQRIFIYYTFPLDDLRPETALGLMQLTAVSISWLSVTSLCKCSSISNNVEIAKNVLFTRYILNGMCNLAGDSEDFSNNHQREIVIFWTIICAYAKYSITWPIYECMTYDNFDFLR